MKYSDISRKSEWVEIALKFVGTIVGVGRNSAETSSSSKVATGTDELSNKCCEKIDTRHALHAFGYSITEYAQKSCKLRHHDIVHFLQ